MFWVFFAMIYIPGAAATGYFTLRYYRKKQRPLYVIHWAWMIVCWPFVALLVAIHYVAGLSFWDWKV